MPVFPWLAGERLINIPRLPTLIQLVIVNLLKQVQTIMK